MAKVSFTGGPLDQQIREMDVYVDLIPVHYYNGQGYAYNENEHPEAYYLNVNARNVDRELRNHAFTHYVFHIDGRRVPVGSPSGRLDADRPPPLQNLRPSLEMDAERSD